MTQISNKRFALVLTGILILCIAPVIGALDGPAQHIDSSLHGWTDRPAHAIPAPTARITGTA